MCQPLPESQFAWVDPATLPNVSAIPEDGDTSYIQKVDIEYPEALHDDHDRYPLAPEVMTIEKSWLIEYELMLLQKANVDHVPCDKLVPNL